VPRTKYGSEAERKAARVASTLRSQEKNAERHKAYMLRYSRKEYPRLRDAVVAKLGGKCQKCGYDSDRRALQIDHIDGNGRRERKTIGWRKFYGKILDDSTNYQLLCANCNYIKRYDNEEVYIVDERLKENTTMPFPNAGAVDTSTKEGVKGYLLARLATQQTTNVAANDHLKLDTVVAFRGSDITLDTTTAYVTTTGAASIGRFTLKAGKTYKLRAQVPYLLASGATGLLEAAFYDATAGAVISTGVGLAALVATTATHDIGGGLAEAIFTPTQDSLVELRFIVATAVTQIGTTANNRQPSVFIETI